MGRKKKFIDKRNSAVFKLLCRDTSNGPASSDQVFVRVDNNPYSSPNFFGDDDVAEAEGVHNAEEVIDPSVFADADEDDGSSRRVDDSNCDASVSTRSYGGGRALADQLRKEILELGLPDDGYNYLIHLREIKNSGGAVYHQNHDASMNLVPPDSKAYDASKVKIRDDRLDKVDEGSMMTAVAEKTVPIRVNKAIDEEVAKLLDDGEWSMFGSDVEDLEEDFVAKANLQDGGAVEAEGVLVKAKVCGEVDVDNRVGMGVVGWLESSVDATKGGQLDDIDEFGEQNERTRRLLDAQFDLLALKEYGSDSDENDVHYEKNEATNLAIELNDALKEYHMDEMELEDKYKVPADFKLKDPKSGKSTLANFSDEIIRKCAEYAETYDEENEDTEVLFEESSDESENWDCETIVSTYSNLNNHPGKIQAPEKPQKKLPQLLPGAVGEKNSIITLKGKEKLPVDFLPNSKGKSSDKVKRVLVSGPEQLRRKRPQKESKEAKKDRKVAVKEEKREARRAKKDLKGLYKSEAYRAQKVAAFSGPSSIRLM